MESDNLELPTPELRAAAFERFGETDETRRTKLNELTSAVRKLPNSHIFDCSKNNLIRYLRGRQFNVQRATQCVKCMIEFSVKYPQWVTEFNLDDHKTVKSISHALDVRGLNGEIVCMALFSNILRACTADFMEKHPDFLMQLNVFCNNYMSHLPEVQVYGAISIVSFSGLTSRQMKTSVAALLPFHERLAFYKFQSNCSAFNLEHIYLFDEPFYTRWCWSMALSFLSSEVKHRLHHCGRNFDVLKETLDIQDMDLLPECLGGFYELETHCMGKSWREDHTNLFPDESVTDKMMRTCRKSGNNTPPKKTKPKTFSISRNSIFGRSRKVAAGYDEETVVTCISNNTMLTAEQKDEENE